MSGDTPVPVVLASASETRRLMLQRAGVPVICRAANLDEGLIKRRAWADGLGADQAARQLAAQKALAVAGAYPGSLIIGADQMLECDGRWFDKPDGVPGAREQLLALRGRCHVLSSAVVLVAGNPAMVVWQHVEQARLTMRSFSDAFLDWYLGVAGPEVSGSVGAYRIEELGLQLFSDVVGDHSVILGLPLLPLIATLRAYQELRT